LDIALAAVASTAAVTTNPCASSSDVDVVLLSRLRVALR
jgi:hypothetical protein